MAENISINFFLKVLKRFWWLMLAVAILFSAGAYIVKDRSYVPTYSSTVKFMVWNLADNSQIINSGNLTGADRVAQDYVTVIKGNDSRRELKRGVKLLRLEDKGVDISRRVMKKLNAYEVDLSDEDIELLQKAGIHTDVDLEGTAVTSIELEKSLKLWDRDKLVFEYKDAEGKTHKIAVADILEDTFKDNSVDGDVKLAIGASISTADSSFTLSATNLNSEEAYRISRAVEGLMPEIIAKYYPSSGGIEVGDEIKVQVTGPDGQPQTVIGKVEEAPMKTRLKVLEPASFPSEVGNNAKETALIVALIAVVAVYALCFLIMFCNTTIRNPEDMVEKLGQAPLGVCPTWDLETDDKNKDAKGKGKKKKAKAGDAKADGEEEARRCLTASTPFAIREGFNQLRTNLMYVPKEEGGCPVYAITSVDVGTGKSTISTNIAISFANISKKVLLIDADLRCPVQYSAFNEKKHRRGLSELLSGIVTDDKEAIKPTSVPNLDLLTSGQIPPNPSELISSERFTKLIEKWRQEYDVIFVDLPPVGIVNDPMAICAGVTGYVFVVRSGRDSSKKVRFAISETEKIGGKVIGVVLNDMDPKGGVFGGGYYGGYYGTQYGKYGKYGKYAKKYGKYDKYSKYGRYSRYSRYAKYAKYAKYAQYEQSHEAVLERLRQEQAAEQQAADTEPPAVTQETPKE